MYAPRAPMVAKAERLARIRSYSLARARYSDPELRTRVHTVDPGTGIGRVSDTPGSR